MNTSYNLYKSQLAANPDSAVYYGNRAAAYLMLDKYADALKDCESALSRDPKFVRVTIISRINYFYYIYIYHFKTN